eukprot:4500277-Pyramimonas_sp.AAC.1
MWDRCLVVGNPHQVTQTDMQSSFFVELPTCRVPGSAIEVQLPLANNIQVGPIDLSAWSGDRIRVPHLGASPMGQDCDVIVIVGEGNVDADCPDVLRPRKDWLVFQGCLSPRLSPWLFPGPRGQRGRRWRVNAALLSQVSWFLSPLELLWSRLGLSLLFLFRFGQNVGNVLPLHAASVGLFVLP